MTDEFEKILTGMERPHQIPDDWSGMSLGDNKGWKWFNSSNPGNCVRFYRGNAADQDVSKQQPYVIVTQNGYLVGRDGKPSELIFEEES